MRNIHTPSHFSAIVCAPFGAIGIRTAMNQVQELVYLPASFQEQAAQEPFSALVVQQIETYFINPNVHFNLPLVNIGTPFQNRVWQAISAIPCGEVRTYGQIAKQIQSAPRAVGQACGANWFPLIIPCHRVTASRELGGFSNHDDADGFHVGVKRWLLAHEGVAIAPN